MKEESLDAGLVRENLFHSLHGLLTYSFRLSALFVCPLLYKVTATESKKCACVCICASWFYTLGKEALGQKLGTGGQGEELDSGELGGPHRLCVEAAID